MAGLGQGRLSRERTRSTRLQQDIERYKEAYRQLGAISAMIGWYRALAQRIAKNKGRANVGNIAAPTLVIWDENIVCAVRKL